MASGAIMYNTPEDVRRNFKRCNHPFYAVVDSKNEIIWTNTEESDVDAAAELLFDDLKTLRPENSAVYVIKHFSSIPANGIKKTTEPDCISTFKQRLMDDMKLSYLEGRNVYNSEILSEIRSLKDEVSTMKLQLSMEDSPTDEEVKSESSASGILGAIVGNPQIMNLITNVIANIFTNNLNNNQAMQQPLSLAGTETQQSETLEDIINRLYQKGVTPEDLQKLSNMSDAKIKMLLTLLRAK